MKKHGVFQTFSGIILLLTMSPMTYAQQQTGNEVGCDPFWSSPGAQVHRQVVDSMKIKFADRQFAIDSEAEKIKQMESDLGKAKMTTAETWSVALSVAGFSLFQEMRKTAPRLRMLKLPSNPKFNSVGRAIASILSFSVAGLTTADVAEMHKELEKKQWAIESQRADLEHDRQAANQAGFKIYAPAPPQDCPGLTTSTEKRPNRSPAVIPEVGDGGPVIAGNPQ